MGEGEELWKKYCSFLDKPFSKQLEYNERKLDEYFKSWKRTNMAKQLCPKGIKKFEEVPLTTYGDYPILHEFGKRMERLEQTLPKRKGEVRWDYYLRISKQITSMLDGWMTDEYGFCSKTSGTTGKSKWFVYGKSFCKNTDSIISSGVMICSDCPGDTKLRKGDTFLNVTSPPPYASSYYIHFLQQVLKPVPSPELVDEIPDMRKKIWIILKMIKKGQRIDVAGGVASVFYMFSRYFTEPDKLFHEYYQSMNFGFKKFLLYLKYLQSRALGRKLTSVKEAMRVKGIGLSGYDTRLYLEYIKNEFGVTPVGVYGSTEFGIPMYGHADKKNGYLPDLRTGYFEFLTEKGEVKKIDELKKGQVYDIVGTPFGTMLIRYNIGDQLRVIDFRDDGLPVFDVEGRKEDVIDIHGYFRITQAIAVKAMVEAGFKETDNWCIAKVIDPKEQLLFLMEKEWKFDEEKAAELLFQAMQKIDPYFQNYVKDFRIKKPSEVIKVEYLKKGAFTRYAIKKVREGVPVGNIKPPKLVGVKKLEIVDLLRRI